MRLSALHEAADAGRDRVLELAEAYGIDFTDDGAEEFCDRFGVSLAPAFWR